MFQRAALGSGGGAAPRPRRQWLARHRLGAVARRAVLPFVDVPAGGHRLGVDRAPGAAELGPIDGDAGAGAVVPERAPVVDRVDDAVVALDERAVALERAQHR